MPLFAAVTTCLPVWHCTACLPAFPGLGNREMIVIALVLAFKRPFNGHAFHRRAQQGFRKPTSQHHGHRSSAQTEVASNRGESLPPTGDREDYQERHLLT